MTCHLKREQLPSGGDREVTICTGVCKRQLQRQSLVLPSSALSAAGTLSPFRKVKAPPPPPAEAFFIFQKSQSFSLHPLSSLPQHRVTLGQAQRRCSRRLSVSPSSRPLLQLEGRKRYRLWKGQFLNQACQEDCKRPCLSQVLGSTSSCHRDPRNHHKPSNGQAQAVIRSSCDLPGHRLLPGKSSFMLLVTGQELSSP